MIVGNDISHWQGTVDWAVYKNNTNFVIVKSTEGNGGTDAKFLSFQKAARLAGIPLGYYHFARPDLGNTPEVEANYFLSVVGNPVEGEVYCLDFEPNWNGDAVTWCKNFLTTVQMAIGVKCFIYLNQSQIKAYNWASISNEGFPLWIAAYTGSPTNTSYTLGSWPKAMMHQWTNSQVVPGISGGIDGDAFHGTIDDFKKCGYKAPLPPEPTPPPVTCEQRINEAVAKAKSESEEKWRLEVETAKGQIDALIKLQAENMDWRTLWGLAVKKMWIWKKGGGT